MSCEQLECISAKGDKWWFSETSLPVGHFSAQTENERRQFGIDIQIFIAHGGNPRYEFAQNILAEGIPTSDTVSEIKQIDNRNWSGRCPR